MVDLEKRNKSNSWEINMDAFLQELRESKKERLIIAEIPTPRAEKNSDVKEICKRIAVSVIACTIIIALK